MPFQSPFRFVPTCLIKLFGDSKIISYKKGVPMPRVSLNQPAPDFSMPDFSGKVFTLADLRGQKNVLLVFNRTFV